MTHVEVALVFTCLGEIEKYSLTVKALLIGDYYRSLQSMCFHILRPKKSKKKKSSLLFLPLCQVVNLTCGADYFVGQDRFDELRAD